MTITCNIYNQRKSSSYWSGCYIWTTVVRSQALELLHKQLEDQTFVPVRLIERSSTWLSDVIGQPKATLNKTKMG